MYFKYGDYQHEDNEVSFEHSRVAKLDSGGVVYGYDETYKLMGRLHADTQEEITTAIDALKTAYAKQFQDLVLYDNSGTATSHTLRNSETLGGVRVLDGPSFPNSTGAEYSTWRSYEIVVAAVVPISGQGNGTVIDWQETLTFMGTGGPRNVWQPMITGPAIKQQVSQFTTVRAVQRGTAAGFSEYIPYANPIFPIDVEHQEQRVWERGTPQFMGGGVRRYFPCTWTYVYEFNNPQTGNPTGRPS